MELTLLVKQLILHEGIRYKPYDDSVGVLTIGVGRNLIGKGISRAEALMLLQNDIDQCIVWLDEKVPWWRRLTEARRHVLIDMCFNLGIGGLMKFRKTLALIEIAAYEKAAIAMLQSTWAKQVGKRAQRLADMMRTGEFPPDLKGAA